MKILIIKLSSLGDVVHTLAALGALHRGLSSNPALGGGLIIDWLVEENFSGLLTGHPMINEVITVKKGAWLKTPMEALRVARRIRAKRYDMVIDFQGLLKSGVWVVLSRAKRKIGFSNARELSHIFLNEKLPPYDKETHAVDRYLNLAEYAGGDSSHARFPLSVGADAERSIDALLKENGLEAGNFFAVAPSARWKTKLWNAEGFSEVIRLVGKQLGMRAVLVGSSGDFEELENIRRMAGDESGVGGALNLAGRTGLKELSRLLELAKFAVTVDTGPMHVAVACGTPVVAIFGPTSPGRTGPYGKGHIVVRKGLECSPCFKRECSDVKCMNSITPELVMTAIAEVAGRPVLRMTGASRRASGSFSHGKSGGNGSKGRKR